MNDAKYYVFPNKFTNIGDLKSLPSYDVLSGDIAKNLYEEIDETNFHHSIDERPSIRIDKTESNNKNNNNAKQPSSPYWTRKKLIILFSLLALIVIVLVIAVVFIVLATASKLFWFL